jgi:SAM-dependent methyltransferase
MVNTTGTVADARAYWRRYYAEQFRFGLGTEDILAALMQVPPVRRWVDLGCGSESMLWAIALRARRLVALDADPQRLDILRRFVATAQPRGVHTTALRLCGRTRPDEFAARCQSLCAVIQADCLAGPLPADPNLTPGSFDLLTQFGLLGLCRDVEHFTASFVRLHRLLAPGGWAAGANWAARHQHGRVELGERLYRDAADRAGVHLLLLHRIASTDPDFPAVWMYVGKTRRTSPCPPPHRPAT